MSGDTKYNRNKCAQYITIRMVPVVDTKSRVLLHLRDKFKEIKKSDEYEEMYVQPSVLYTRKGGRGLHEWAGLHCIVIVEQGTVIMMFFQKMMKVHGYIGVKSYSKTLL